MERLLLKVFCLPEQFMLCGLTLFDFHILEFYFKKKNVETDGRGFPYLGY